MSLLGELDVIVLAGGRATRLGGVDKAELEYLGAPLRQHILASVQAARKVAWVGDSTPALALDTRPGLRITRESPAFAGPAAALGAGLTALDDDPATFTLVLAVDLPRVGAAVPLLLRGFVEYAGGVIAVDESGRRQYLLGVYPSLALRAQARLAAPLAGLPVRRLIDPLEVTEVRVGRDACADIDTAVDAARHGIRLPTPTGRSQHR